MSEVMGVYKITNTVNKKIYIGSSVNIKQRWRQHISNAFNKNSSSYYYPLQTDMRLFGVEKFNFEILKNDFMSQDDMHDYEKEQIIEQNALRPNGYNQTLVTNLSDYIPQDKKQPCAWVDKEENIIEIYESYHAADRAHNLSNADGASKVRLVCKGILNTCFNGKYFRDIDNQGKIIHQEVKSRKNRKAIVAIPLNNPEEPQYFDSVSGAAKILQTDRSSISKCIRGDKKYSQVKGFILREIDINGNVITNNIDINERIKKYNERNPIINGVQKTIAEWSREYNINPDTVNARIKTGWDVIAAITTPVK